jgi:enoyl-CoA hydratase/carnithine racemase
MEWGLVNRVVPAEQLDAEVLQLAKTIAAKPPATVTAGKRGFYQQMELDLAKAYELAGQVISSDFAHPKAARAPAPSSRSAIRAGRSSCAS